MVGCINLTIRKCFHITMWLGSTSGHGLLLTPRTRRHHLAVSTASTPGPLLGYKTGAAAIRLGTQLCAWSIFFLSPVSVRPCFTRTSTGSQKPWCLHWRMLAYWRGSHVFVWVYENFQHNKGQSSVHEIDYNLSVWEGQCAAAAQAQSLCINTLSASEHLWPTARHVYTAPSKNKIEGKKKSVKSSCHNFPNSKTWWYFCFPLGKAPHWEVRSQRLKKGMDSKYRKTCESQRK